MQHQINLNVVILPTAALEPIRQFPRKGRFPSVVTNIRRGYELMRMDARAREAAKMELDRAEEFYFTSKFLTGKALERLQKAREADRIASAKI